MPQTHDTAARRILSVFFAFIVAFLATPALADDGAQDDAGGPPAVPASAPEIWVINFEGEIAGVHQAYLRRHLERAEKEKPDFLVLRFNSPGGTVYHSMLISEQLFTLPDSIHTVAWIPKEAISGACMAAMACDEIVMGRAGTIGDCQPIIMDPEGGGVKPVGEKIESPLRALFRKYAEAAGHPVQLAESFVSQHLEVIEVIDSRDDSRSFIDGKWYNEAKPDDLLDAETGTKRSHLNRIGSPVVEEGELLTITGPEAIRLGFMTRTFEDGSFPKDEAALLDALGGPTAKVEQISKTFSEKAAKWLLAFGGILAAVIALSVLMFMYQGPGVMTIVGISALILLLLINATAEQLHAIPLFLVLVGAALLAVEVLFIPGFALFGILGLAAMGFGFLLLVTGSNLSAEGPSISKDAAMSFGLQFVGGCLAGVVVLVFLTRFFPNMGPGRKLMLTANPGGGGSAVALAAAPNLTVGTEGVASSVLRPAGSATFGDVFADVTSDGRFIDPGTPLRIIAVEGTRILVEPLTAETSSSGDATSEGQAS